MRRENRNSDFFIKIFPFLISAVVAIIDCKINFIYAGSKGIDTLFSNLINVFAIIVGVLIALFGVLPSVHSSLIMKRIHKKNNCVFRHTNGKICLFLPPFIYR